MSRVREPVRIVPKGWGREVWIANGDLYCGKILEITKGKKLSLHYHKIKSESFYLRAGRLVVRIKESPEAETLEELYSNPANAWTSRLGWSIRWKRSKTQNSTNSRPSTSTPIRIGWYLATDSSADAAVRVRRFHVPPLDVGQLYAELHEQLAQCRRWL